MIISPVYGLPIAESTDIAKQYPETVDEPRTLEIERLLGEQSALIGGMKYHGGTTVQAVSASGGITVQFGFAWAAPPIMIVCLGNESGTAAYVQVVASAVTTTQFGVRVKNASNAAVTSGQYQIDWLAIGEPSTAATKPRPPIIDSLPADQRPEIDNALPDPQST